MAAKPYWVFVVMALGVLAALFSLAAHSFPGFFLAFMVLFLTASIGAGEAEHAREARSEGARAEAARLGQKEASFALGFAGAVAAYGGFVIPQAYKYSIGVTGRPQTALMSFVAFYVTCIAVTWWFYYRLNAKMP